MDKIIDKLLTKSEEALEEYSKKTAWAPADLEGAHKAAETYEILRAIKMDMDMEKDGVSHHNYSHAMHMPHISYGDESYARGRDMRTGRYVSRGDGMYYDEMRHHSGADESMARGRRRGGRSMSDINDQMIEKLEYVMRSAGSEHDREKVREIINMIECDD